MLLACPVWVEFHLCFVNVFDCDNTVEYRSLPNYTMYLSMQSFTDSNTLSSPKTICLFPVTCVFPSQYGEFTKMFSHHLNYPCAHVFINVR